MGCADIRELFSPYIDGQVTPEEKRVVEEHVAACPACNEELQFLKQCLSGVSSLPKVKPPEDFLEKARQRLERRSQFEDIIGGFFKPTRQKVQVAVALATVIMGIGVYRAMESHLPQPPAHVAPAMESREGKEDSSLAALHMRKSPGTLSISAVTAVPVAPARSVTSLAGKEELAQEVSGQEAETVNWNRLRSAALEEQAVPHLSARASSSMQALPEMAYEQVEARYAGISLEEAGEKAREACQSSNGVVIPSSPGVPSSDIVMIIPAREFPGFISALSTTFTVTGATPGPGERRSGQVMVIVHLSQ